MLRYIGEEHIRSLQNQGVRCKSKLKWNWKKVSQNTDINVYDCLIKISLLWY